MLLHMISHMRVPRTESKTCICQIHNSNRLAFSMYTGGRNGEGQLIPHRVLACMALEPFSETEAKNRTFEIV